MIFRYSNVQGKIDPADPLQNPNGSARAIAGICSRERNVVGLMPHPERGMFFIQRPDWPVIKEKYLREKKKLPTDGPGLQVFKNAVKYFK